MDGPPLLKPHPRRPHERTAPSFLGLGIDDASPTSTATNPSKEHLGVPDSPSDGDLGSKSRSRSVVNLTASTLFGIYAPQHMNEPPTDPSSPFGTGAETPLTPLTHSNSEDSFPTSVNAESVAGYFEGSREVAGSRYLESRRRPPTGAEISRRLREQQVLPDRRVSDTSRRISTNGVHKAENWAKTTTAKTEQRSWTAAISSAVFLCIVGIAYGAFVAILPVHGDQEHLHQFCLDRIQEPITFIYLAAWGAAGVILGTLLPVAEKSVSLQPSTAKTATAQSPTSKSQSSPVEKNRHGKHHRHKQEARASEPPTKGKHAFQPSLIEEWSPVIRSIGAFVGIAFAIRKLEWETTLQLSATLALTNPFLWYLLDRTSAGLAVATAVSTLGTAVVLFSGASFPSPLAVVEVHSSDLPVDMASRSNVNAADVVWVGSVLFWSSVCFGSIGRLLRSSSTSR
jgi:Insulin-induced protein (INSIG)